MLKIIASVAVTLAIAIGGGAASVWYALETIDGLGAVEIGPWTAYPDAGAPDADPYAAARAAREAELALGRSEGLEFIAYRDSVGDPLRRECGYRVVGAAPPARFFTLYAADVRGNAIIGWASRSAGIDSYAMLRGADGVVSIAVDPHPTPGNWLAIAGEGPMSVILTLYDASVAAAADIEAIALPGLVKIGCPT